VNIVANLCGDVANILIINILRPSADESAATGGPSVFYFLKTHFMKKNYALIITAFVILVVSCQSEKPNNPPANTAEKPFDSTAVLSNEKIHLHISNPQDIWATDYLAFEIKHSQNYQGRNVFEYYDSGYKKVESVGAKCWNLAFYNTRNRDYYLLEPTKKMMIYQYELNDTSNGRVNRDFGLYNVQFDDNKDGKFTDADAKRLFVSTRLGKNFHQVSPDGVDMRHKSFSPKENFLIIYGAKDSNNDGFFNEKDQEIVYRLDLNQSAETMTVAQPIFSKDFQNALQRKIETEWKLNGN
jgi:hypothetical protein